MISFEKDTMLAHQHWEEIKRTEAFNNIVGRMPTDEQTMLKFYKSPEFFRYQVCCSVPCGEFSGGGGGAGS